MYDIFYISSRNKFPYLKDLKNRFPHVKTANSIKEAKTKSLTNMCWILQEDASILDTFNFTFDVPDWDKKYVHVFKDKEGNITHKVSLIPKNIEISKKENDLGFFLNSKDVDLVACQIEIKPYDKFYIETYEDYLNALETSTTEMFWGIWKNIEIIDDSIFNYVFPHEIKFEYDRTINHVWLNRCNTTVEYENGLVLFSKLVSVTKKEIEHKVLLNRKEHDTVVSKKLYNKFYIETYEDYLNALENSTTEMFWGIWKNIEIIDNAIFNYVFPSNGMYNFDRSINHVWLNQCNNKTDYRNGLTLFSKSVTVSKKEIEFKSILNRKEHTSIISKSRYPRYFINTYDDYLRVKEECDQPLFWCIWNEITITDESIFDLYFDPYDGIYDFDRSINHVFKNKDIDEYKYNGVMLMSKKKPVPKREIDFRFIVDKKEHDIVVSKLKPYDIVFISYNEPNAEHNYQLLLSKKLENTIHRVHGVKGIHNAHLQAAKLVSTPMFFVVDGDAIIKDEFDFSHLVPRYDRYIVHVWNSENPINGLQYGYGGVKLLPTKQTLEMDLNSPDMTSSISTGFRVMPNVSNITAFNTDEFSTWRSAFRECAKLSSKIILGQVDEETESRLETWCTTMFDVPYNQYALAGALAGKEYGIKNAGNVPALNMINDFNWLKSQFDSRLDIIGNTLEITSAQALATS